MSAKRVEYEGKLEAEVDSRERTESQLADKTSQLTQVLRFALQGRPVSLPLFRFRTCSTISGSSLQDAAHSLTRLLRTMMICAMNAVRLLDYLDVFRENTSV